jgi:hypothetical protein
MLLHIAAEGVTQWSNTVCAALRDPGPMSPSRVAETLANGLRPTLCSVACSPTFSYISEYEVDLDRVVEIRRTSAAAEMSLADATSRRCRC